MSSIDRTVEISVKVILTQTEHNVALTEYEFNEKVSRQLEQFIRIYSGNHSIDWETLKVEVTDN